MAQEILLNDTFTRWMQKINEMTREVNQLVVDPNVGFSYDVASVGLNAKIFSGKFRDGSSVEVIPDFLVGLPPSTSSVVCIYKKPGDAAIIKAYKTAEVPTKFVVPLWGFQTSASSIIAYTDLRTEFATSGGTAGSATGVLIFDKLIESDVNIGSEQGGLSIDPIVAPGVTVTVQTGGTWVVL